MKNLGVITIILALFALSSCADKPSRPDSILSESQKAAADAAAEAAAAAGIQAAPVGVAGLPHYYCPNNCEGSGGDSQANCPTCGTAYVHNQAFHNQTPTAPATTITSPTVVGGDGGFATPITTPVTTTSTTPPPSPAQNANGVYHYTCPAGCAGGAAGAGSCSGCGGALAHNQEYHNN